MALRYYIEYLDVVDNTHRLDIYDDDFVGTALQVDGRITLNYAEVDDPLEAIRGQGLTVELEADETLTFNDLWSEEEKTFRVDYIREGVTIFNGWLNPEGFFESFVNTNWKVSFECVDGLGFLSDLSFVDSSGFPIVGKKTYLEIISIALKRTGLQLNINTNIDIYYTGIFNTVDILANVFANTERYIKDDGETIMDCEEVLRDILEPFGAVLTSLNGEWYIYKPNQLYLNSTATFYTYNHLGVPIAPTTIELDLSQPIGSNFQGALIFHCNGNQTIRNTSSVGAYRVSYKYGLANTITANPFLLHNGSVIDGWTINNNTNMTLNPSGAGVNFIFDIITDVINLISDDITMSTADTANVEVQFNTVIANINNQNVELEDFGIFHFTINLTDGIDTYSYDQGTQTWSIGVDLFGHLIPIGSTGTATTYNGIITSPPVNGQLYISIKTPQGFDDETPGGEIYETDGEIYLTKFSVSPSGAPIGGDTNIIGEFHTVQRTTKPSAKVDEVKKVATGDNPTDFYEGTIYKNDLTPTITWNRKGITEVKPILQIMGEENLRIAQLPSRVFSGDIFGFFNYLSVISISGLNGLFMPIKYNYDTKANVISVEFRQIYGNELTDISYVKTFDYGRTVKPTIKG